MTWREQFSDGVNVENTIGGFKFDFPKDPGHINYIVAPYDQPVELGMKLRMKWRIKRTAGAPQFISLDGSTGLKPNFRPMFCDDPLQNRWWSNPDCVFLQEAVDQTLVVATGLLVVPIRARRWSNVMGKMGNTVKPDFLRDLKVVRYVALTFGGGNSFGHGLRVKLGNVRVELLDFTIS